MASLLRASTSAIRQRPPTTRKTKTSTTTARPAADKLCFYHRRFGSSARQCQEPCTWSGPEVSSASSTKDCLLFVTDRISGRRFLVDTGAEVSVIPATGLNTRIEQPGHTLTAANGSEWSFVVADVSRPLLGADFLRSKSLLVDLKGKRLVDTETFQSVPLGKAEVDAPHLDAISTSTNQYDRLLAEFPDITVANFAQQTTKHGVEHFVTTKGPPVHAHARRLPPDKLEICQSGIQQDARNGNYPQIIQPHYTWCLKSLEVGDHVGITDASLFLIATRYPIFRILQPTWQRNTFSRRSTSCAATTSYQSLRQMYRKLPSSPHLGCLNS